ncbi:MAG: SDR family NAD(P)-dependent oxidoreductase [Anaerolineae bacterium]|nr:SDR family NAD(P)-dependent oxidoreductase [Anaerolineae bacterium]
MTGSKLLDNRVAVVTGASSGIGRATALALAREGAHVALAARTESALRRVAGEIHALGREALFVPTDVTRQDDVDHLMAKTWDRWERIDILVANAGAYIRSPVTKLTVEEMEESMAVNFYGALHTVLAAQPHLLDQGDGHIVLVSSFDAKKGLPLDAPYVAAKFALAGYGEVLRQELRGHGIHVTTVFPGRVDTPLIDDLKVPQISAKICPETVACQIVAAIRQKRPEVIVPLQARLLHLVNVLSPRLGDWFVRHFHLQGWEKRGAGS